MATTGPALVKQRDRLERLLKAMPEDVTLATSLAETLRRIRSMGICHRCGRPLSDGEAEYGPDCLVKVLAERAERQ